MTASTNSGLTRRGFVAVSAGTVTGAGALAAVGTPARAEEADASAAEAATPYAGLNPQATDYRSDSGDLSAVFSEWQLGSLTIPNRMVKSAAGSDTFASGNPTEAVEYHANFARGGIGMVWVENFLSPYRGMEDPEASPARALCEAVHEAGAYVGYQFDTMGTDFSPMVYPDDPFLDSFSLDQVHELQQTMIEVATTAHELGFDGFEINAAGNNAGQAFLSRMRNNRTDEYGPQSFESRTLFVREIIEGIKAACGNDFVVQVLINGIEENDKSLGQNSQMTTVEENKEIARLLESAGADSLHVRLGPLGMHVCQFASDLYFTGRGIEGTTAYGNQFDFARHWQGKLDATHSGCGMMLDVAAEIKSAVSIPVGTVTYMDPAHAPDLFNAAIAEGKVDFLLMNRPLTCDPEYANKLRDGRADEIMPCTRCMHCHQDKDAEGNSYEHCRVNACTQRAYRDAMPEGYELPPADGEKRVMVIGGGPAGMEAARIAAKRGYDVTLYEKKGYLGGLLPFASAVKGPHENLDDYNVYLQRQLELCGVTVVLDNEVTSELIASEAPDAVVLAAGGVRDSLGLAATSGTAVISIDDVVTAEIGQNVTVVGGGAQATDVTLYLLEQGKNVTMVLPGPLSDLEKGHSNWVKQFVTPMLYARGVRVWPNASIATVGDGEVTVSGETGVDIPVACDTVIEAMDMLPNTSLIDGLDIPSYAVGDCSEPFNIAEAVTAANLCARSL